MQEGCPIAYSNEKLSAVALNYPIYDKETYALINICTLFGQKSF